MINYRIVTLTSGCENNPKELEKLKALLLKLIESAQDEFGEIYGNPEVRKELINIAQSRSNDIHQKLIAQIRANEYYQKERARIAAEMRFLIKRYVIGIGALAASFHLSKWLITPKTTHVEPSLDKKLDDDDQQI